MSRAWVIAAAIAVAQAVPAVARSDDTMRCNGRVISVGMNKAQVQAACGAPDSAEDVPQPVRSGNQVVGQTVQSRWTYDSGTVTRVLVFDQDRLISIEMN
ncbi:MAG: DUF2845 domain-containing protein [Steroidobacteraceae bacterium]